MAGIGFELRKLATKDNFLGIIRAYLHSAVIAVGPWMLVVCSLGAIFFFTRAATGESEVNEFLAIQVYNFFFSFTFTAPLYMISARYVSDCLYRKDASPIPGILITSLIYLLIAAIPAATLFYVFYATLKPLSIFFSIVHFIVLCEIWLIMLYLGCLRDFHAITRSWVVGILITAVCAITFGKVYGTPGLLFGFSLGLLVVLYSIIANILSEYPFGFKVAKDFTFYLKNYKSIFWGGFFLYFGKWIDKVIMWWAPDAVVHLNQLRTNPIYDGGMFLANFTIIPVMALFIFSLETNFYETYTKYIHHIERNAPLSLIEEEKKSICRAIIENGRSFLILQGSLSLILIIFAPTLFTWLGVDFLELNIFRLGTLGSFFGVLDLILFIYFSYFDSQANMVKISITMVVSNTVFTLFFRYLGFPYYGYGYCLSMILTFLVGATLMVRFLDQMTYHIFITNIVKRQEVADRFMDAQKMKGGTLDEKEKEMIN